MKSMFEWLRSCKELPKEQRRMREDLWLILALTSGLINMLLSLRCCNIVPNVNGGGDNESISKAPSFTKLSCHGVLVICWEFLLRRCWLQVLLSTSWLCLFSCPLFYVCVLLVNHSLCVWARVVVFVFMPSVLCLFRGPCNDSGNSSNYEN